jgi:hypothetical protein
METLGYKKGLGVGEPDFYAVCNDPTARGCSELISSMG